MILGIGCDILEIKRFQKACTETFIRRVFTEKEQNALKKLKGSRRWNYLAKRFAAKEAFSKACGTGIGKYISWQDIEILNNTQGAPILQLSPQAKSFIKKHFKCSKFNAHISLSDDAQAIAFVILEK